MNKNNDAISNLSNNAIHSGNMVIHHSCRTIGKKQLHEAIIKSMDPKPQQVSRATLKKIV